MFIKSLNVDPLSEFFKIAGELYDPVNALLLENNSDKSNSDDDTEDNSE